MYSINFTEKNKKNCLSLYYNGANSYLFVNGKEIHKFKAKDSETAASPLCLGNISKVFSFPYSRVCVPDTVKKVTVKIFDLMILKNKTKQRIFHESCKCICRLDPIVCNNKRKWNKDKRTCECLVNKKCGNKFWNPNSCKCEYRAAQLTQECKEIIDNKTVLIKETKTISIKENKIISIKNCKPFVASSILFLSVSVIVRGLCLFLC